MARLEELIASEPKPRQRDRYRVALLAVRGWEKLDIAEALNMAKSSVETWAYRYRDGGLAALRGKKRTGAKPKLPPGRQEEFRQRMIGEPRAGDGVCSLRGKDAVRILNEEFGVGYKLNSVYKLLHRLNLSCLTPRPRHEKNDPAKMEEFKKSAPLLSRK
jgi:transposase